MRRPALALGLALLLASGVARGDLITSEGSVYLVYAGPTSTSPASAFGHLFLVASSSADEPVPLWDVVSFSADIGDAGPFRFMVAGVAGGFLGSFKVSEFHEKSRDYQLLEDRDLWLMRLHLSEQERRQLSSALRARRGRGYPYAFFHRNCATYLQSVLAEALDDLPPPGRVVSPIGVFQRVERLGRGVEITRRPALSQRLRERAKDLPDPIIRRLRSADWQDLAADTEWWGAEDREVRGFLQEFFRWKTLQQEVPLDPRTGAGLAALRLQNARLEAGAAPQRTTSPGIPTEASRFHPYARVTVSSRHQGDRPARLHLRLRPSLHDDLDPWEGYRPVNTLDLLTVEVSTPSDRADLRLEELVLFSQRSLNAADWMTTPESWALEVAARRGGPLGADRLHSGLGVGWGRARRAPLASTVHALLTAEVLGAGDAHVLGVLGVRTGLLALRGDRWRAGLAGGWKTAALGRSGSFGWAEGWLRRDLGRRAGLSLRVQRIEDAARLRLDLSLYL